MKDISKYAKHTINIETNAKFSLRRFLNTMLLIVVLTGFGSLVDSPPMQWVGFIILIVLALAVMIHMAGKNTGLTIQQARERLDEIERDEVGQ